MKPSGSRYKLGLSTNKNPFEFSKGFLLISRFKN